MFARSLAYRTLPLVSRLVSPSVKCLQRGFATKFYDSPLFKSLQNEFEYSVDNEMGSIEKSLSKKIKQFEDLGWQLDTEEGNTEFSLMKPIADDEHVMVTMSADSQQDLTADEETGDVSSQPIEFRVVQNIGDNFDETATEKKDEENEEDEIPLPDLQMIFHCVNTPEDPLKVVHMDCTLPMDMETEDNMMYHGPPFKSLDDKVQQEVMKHLKDLGIDKNFTTLLREFALDKEFFEYINWLKKIVVDPETEENQK
ncbi:hypothetical protein WA158_001542 [Blastocystis sp. Blastoise]